MEFFSTYIGKLVSLFFLSMVPVIELRGAIPLAEAYGIDLSVALPICVLGNMVPVPFIILFIRKIFEWLRAKSAFMQRVVSAMEQKAEKNRAVVDRYKFWGLFLLVAIPLPGTGAWTGALVAAVLEMRLKKAIPAILLGVIAAGLIMTVLSKGVSFMFF